MLKADFSLFVSSGLRNNQLPWGIYVFFIHETVTMLICMNYLISSITLTKGYHDTWYFWYNAFYTFYFWTIVCRAVSCFIINIKYNFSHPGSSIDENRSLHLAQSELIFHKNLYPSFSSTAKVLFCFKSKTAFSCMNTHKTDLCLTLWVVPSMSQIHPVLWKLIVLKDGIII